MSLSDRLVAIIEAIVDDYESQPPDERHRLLHIRAGGMLEGFNGWDDTKPVVTRDDLDDLSAYGLIDIDYGGTGSYMVKPTPEGIRGVRTVRRERARTEIKQAVDLSWATVRPILHAVVDVWAESGASTAGFVPVGAFAERVGRPADDLGLIRAIELLAENEWVNAHYNDEDELMAQPTTRGVMATRGWPGGDPEVAAERLLSALDEVADSASDDQTRGWAARARETLMEIGTKTLAEVVSKSVGTAV
jgi:hypothetical protein